jgi:hypothetical protein
VVDQCLQYLFVRGCLDGRCRKCCCDLCTCLLIIASPDLVAAQDMNQLQSLFSAKPWQQGPYATIKFLFRAHAARAARMRRSAHLQSPVPQQQATLPVVQQLQKPTQQQPMNEADTSLSHIYVECTQVKQHAGDSTADR